VLWQKELDFGETFNCTIVKGDYFAHFHEEMEIALCIEGRYNLRLDEIEYEVSAGDITIISSMVTHEIKEIEDTSIIYVIFGRKLLGKDFDLLERRDFSMPILKASHSSSEGGLAGAAEKLRRIMLDIYHEKVYTGICSNWIVCARTLEIFALLMREFPVKGSEEQRGCRRTLSGDSMTAVMAMINREYYREITVEEAAAAAYLSKNYFCRAFKATTGTPFHEYLMGYRVSCAKKLLLQEELKIGEIAEKVGIPVAKTFNRCFKEKTGMTPSEYRKKYISAPKTEI